MDYVDKSIGLWERGDYRIQVYLSSIQYETRSPVGLWVDSFELIWTRLIWGL